MSKTNANESITTAVSLTNEELTDLVKNSNETVTYYRADSDHLLTFIRQEGLARGTNVIPAAYCYFVYSRWCKDRKISPYTHIKFGMRLSSLFEKRSRKYGVAYLVNNSLLKYVEDFIKLADSRNKDVVLKEIWKYTDEGKKENTKK